MTRANIFGLRVEDDGAGIPAEVAAEPGHGRAGMRGRAAEIGATVAWESPPAGGTVVSLDFDPSAGGRKPES